jgi:hypothetical protein
MLKWFKYSNTLDSIVSALGKNKKKRKITNREERERPILL